MEWFAAFGFPILLWLIDKAAGSPIQHFFVAGARRLRRLQRVGLPADRRAFDKSWAIFCQVPESLRDDKEELVWWLEPSEWNSPLAIDEEFYVIERDRFRRSRGVLYASLFKKPRNRCLVSQLVTREELPPEDVLDVQLRLWRHFLVLIARSISSRNCEFYFEVVDPEGSPTANQAGPEWRRRHAYLSFIQGIDARPLSIRYLLPLRGRDHGKEVVAFVAYWRWGTEDQRLPSPKDTLDFLYGQVWLWTLYSSSEVYGLAQMHDIVEYLSRLTDQVLGSTGASHIPTQLTDE